MQVVSVPVSRHSAAAPSHELGPIVHQLRLRRNSSNGGGAGEIFRQFIDTSNPVLTEGIYEYVNVFSPDCGCIQSGMNLQTMVSTAYNPFSVWTTPFAPEWLGEVRPASTRRTQNHACRLLRQAHPRRRSMTAGAEGGAEEAGQHRLVERGEDQRNL